MKPTSGKKKRTVAPARLQLVKELDLSGKGEKPSLKEFYSRYIAKSNLAKNLIFCYYLEHEIKETPITVNHVFTCYRHIPKVKTPEALAQSLSDTAHLKGWLDTSSLDDIKVSISGVNHLEHELPKAEGK